ncbi:Microcin C7 self-immunity protein MccF [Candidatus Rubidus massiliensis]|nr:Microcin C7 self-immunity protein MccF [Candidatus Rubidus massiliensis]
MKKIFPNKLFPGDEIRILSPARSLGIIDSSLRKIAKDKLEKIGLKVTFSKYCEERDMFDSSSVQSRLFDLHEAFLDKNVKAILTTIGGYNSIQLLEGIKYELIKDNPKILCGYSDITTLQNAIFAKTGIVTYSGPHFSTFGCLEGLDYVMEYFKKCLFDNSEIDIKPSLVWSDDEWYLDQNNRKFMKNEGHIFIQKGFARGTIIGGNIGSFALLQGTEYQPSFKDTILFLEDNYPMTIGELDRQLCSLILQKGFKQVKGIVFGRFQVESKILFDQIKAVIASKATLSTLPIIANVDFGHTLPLCTFPIGGTASIDSSMNHINLKILNE